MTNIVTFKDIPGYEGLYQISESGVVISFYHKRSGVIRKPSFHKYGYPQYLLSKNGIHKNIVCVHTIILETFVCKRPEGMVALHNDWQSIE